MKNRGITNYRKLCIFTGTPGEMKEGIMGKISAFILRLIGWRMEGQVPEDVRKFIIAVVPHTSNWDFPLGLLARSAMRRDVKFIGKHTLFLPPYGFIFRWLGGYPVNRKTSKNYVDSVVEILDSKDEFSICVAPEGTRKKVDRLKTGFYHMARLAKVPIILTKFDYGNKVISFSEPFYTTDDQEADMAFISNYFAGVQGKNPEFSYDPGQTLSS